ncbi:MAG TPA: hypothetical protein VFS33_01720 [Gemmatimonadales bacterium]|nr:hypothetical protein [Gemmatimonadales bacterium]
MRPTKRSDRVLMVLAIVAAVGVGVALWLTRRAGGGSVEWVPNPYRASNNAPAAPPADSTPHPSAAAASDTTASGGNVEVIRVLTTPQRVVVARMTPACKRALKEKGTWKDAARSEPWPECVDSAGRPMVVQFCSYLKLANGAWLPSSNTRNAPRCQAELALVRQGKIPGAR